MLRHAPKVALAGLLALLLGAALVAGIKAALPPGEGLPAVRLGVALFVGGQGALAVGAVAWLAGRWLGGGKRQGRA